jgi:hypothetical protein
MARPPDHRRLPSLPSAGTDARGTLLRVEHPETLDLHTLPSVPGTPVPSLDR